MNAKKIIASAFYELLQKMSIANISVSMIVETAEISKPTFYRYFYNKFELLSYIFEQILSPIQNIPEDSSWHGQMERVFENVESSRAIFRNGFKNEEQYYIRDLYLRQIFESAVNNYLKGRGLDVSDESVGFAVRSCAITHVAAVCGWVNDNKHRPISKAVELLMGTIPYVLNPYFTN